MLRFEPDGSPVVFEGRQDDPMPKKRHADSPTCGHVVDPSTAHVHAHAQRAHPLRRRSRHPVNQPGWRTSTASWVRVSGGAGVGGVRGVAAARDAADPAAVGHDELGLVRGSGPRSARCHPGLDLAAVGQILHGAAVVGFAEAARGLREAHVGAAQHRGGGIGQAVVRGLAIRDRLLLPARSGRRAFGCTRVRVALGGGKVAGSAWWAVGCGQFGHGWEAARPGGGWVRCAGEDHSLRP